MNKKDRNAALHTEEPEYFLTEAPLRVFHQRSLKRQKQNAADKRDLLNSPYLGQVGDAQQEADGVQDVGLAAAIQAGDGVEQRVEPVDLRPLRVGLEPIEYDRLDVHLPKGPGQVLLPGLRRNCSWL